MRGCAHVGFVDWFSARLPFAVWCHHLLPIRTSRWTRALSPLRLQVHLLSSTGDAPSPVPMCFRQ